MLAIPHTLGQVRGPTAHRVATCAFRLHPQLQSHVSKKVHGQWITHLLGQADAGFESMPH